MNTFQIYRKTLLTEIPRYLSVFFKSRNTLIAENIALRSQLSLFQEQVFNKKKKKPNSNKLFRQIWVLLSKFHPSWNLFLVFFKPQTVINWQKTEFKLHWSKKSRRIGRPSLSKDVIKIIRNLYNDNSSMSVEKIYEMLISMNIIDPPSPNTIKKYISPVKKPPTDKQIQSWMTFKKNHRKEIWAMDYMVVPTLKFKLLYVLIIINHDNRKIEHFGVTANINQNISFMITMPYLYAKLSNHF